MTTEPILQTERLSLRFKHKHALSELSLSVARGGIHAIIGANGAGKSSLFRVLLGFEAATSGSARILGCDCARLTPDLRGRIGYVNEEHTLPLWLKVDELTAMQRRLYPGWNEERYRSVVRNFNVLPGQRIAQLSRGERAGVNLALALGQSPELLILDEPTLGLDVVAKRLFLNAMMESSYSDGMTIIYCSHQMEEIERVADQLILLERGRLLHACAPDALCQRVVAWVAEFPFRPPDTSSLPGILATEHIDGLSHFMVLDAAPDFASRLRLLGARSVHTMPVSLERAINALLARGHVATAAAVAQPFQAA